MTGVERALRHRIGPRYRRFRRDRDYRFLVYASARTGSSSLAQAVNDYLGIQCALEPFNKDWGGNVRDRVSDRSSLQREMARLWRRYNGFKHVWEPNGLPFQGQPDLNDYILTEATDRVILLNRKNALRRIVSWHISNQAKVFHVGGDEDRVRLLNHSFSPLDKDAIKEQLRRELGAFAAVTRRLDEVGLPYRSLWYEELFCAESPEQRLGTLENVIEFITGRRFRRRDLKSRALEILSPGTAQTVNSAETYELVPGIHEIENELGSAQTGYLFQ